MKKLILLLIALTTFIYVSYASFPISDTLEVQQDIMQTEEIKQYHYSLQKMGVDLNSCKCVSCRGGIAPLVSKPKPLPIKTKNVKEFEETKTLFELWKEYKATGISEKYSLSMGSRS